MIFRRVGFDGYRSVIFFATEKIYAFFGTGGGDCGGLCGADGGVCDVFV